MKLYTVRQNGNSGEKICPDLRQVFLSFPCLWGSKKVKIEIIVSWPKKLWPFSFILRHKDKHLLSKLCNLNMTITF